jgi:hypothetical protein
MKRYKMRLYRSFSSERVILDRPGSDYAAVSVGRDEVAVEREGRLLRRRRIGHVGVR